ncbi:MAG TPA: hypothetical protein DHW82_02450 [Spirochaetia bacterium]|nr:MAG: hypothetical protein A2Y41_07930 [Spirochaetes bacterium GWB1_36_13]HCL55853.1 hypothetical protein [Spirochaetia bacterium]
MKNICPFFTVFDLETNGLYDDNIRDLRGQADYPEHFKDDIEAFYEFSKDSVFFSAHNIAFDSSFISFLEKKKKFFCTMRENTEIKNGKFPKLMEAADYYGIKVEEFNLHDSRYDAFLCMAVIKAMANEKNKKLLRLLK